MALCIFLTKNNMQALALREKYMSQSHQHFPPMVRQFISGEQNFLWTVVFLKAVETNENEE
jgi:hypothetical protein